LRTFQEVKKGIEIMTFSKSAPTFPFLRTKAQYEGGGRILPGDGTRSDRSVSSALDYEFQMVPFYAYS
jgi:hypothetical protein